MSVEQIHHIDPKIIRRPTQVRTEFGEAEHEEMQASIRSVGILQPVLLRREGNDTVVLDGDRRIRAAIALGLSTVPAVVIEGPLDTAAVIQRQLIANCVREDLSALDQAKAIRQLMQKTNATATEIARQIGKSPSTVSKLLAILTAPAEVQARVASGELGIREAYEAVRRVPVSGEDKPRRSPKYTAVLSGSQSVSFTGVASTVEAAAAAVDDLSSRIKAARRQNIELATFLAMLQDQAK